MEPVVLGPGEGDRLSVAGNDLVFKAEAPTTDGALGLVEYTAGPNFPGPPPHRHREMFDVFFVLEGMLEFVLAEDTVQAPAGTFVAVPPGTVHTFSNPSDAPTRFLSLAVPGGFEQYFRELATALGDGPLDPAVAAPILARYDIEPA